MNRLELKAHFDEVTEFAASAKGDSTVMTKGDFFVPQSENDLHAVSNGVVNMLALRIVARRQQEVDAWMRRVMMRYLPAEVCGAPAVEFAEAVRAAGVYGKEVTFPGDEPGLLRFVLYGRTVEEPHEILGTMVFQPTFNGE